VFNIAIIFAEITHRLMRGHMGALALRGAPDHRALSVVTTRPLAFFSKQTNYIFVTIKQELGRPSYLVHDLTTDLWYKSQRAAAKALEVSEPAVSQHLNGKRSHIFGHQLERVYF
jgi:hypothetical protein